MNKEQMTFWILVGIGQAHNKEGWSNEQMKIFEKIDEKLK